MQSIITIALKDLRLLLRDKFGAFWIFVFPLMFALFFGFVFGGNPASRPMSIAVVDNDESTGSKAFVERLAKSKSLYVTSMPYDQAQEAVRKGRQVAYLVLPRGFAKTITYFGPQQLPMELGVDPSRKAEAGFLQGLIAQAHFSGIQDLMTNPEQLKLFEENTDIPPEVRAMVGPFIASMSKWMAKAGDKAGNTKQMNFEGPAITMQSISRAGVPRSSWEITFPSAILWGVFGCLTGFAASLVKERMQGTFLRLKTAPLTLGEILAGKGSGCFIAIACVSLFFLLIAVFVFGVRVDNWFWLVLALLCTAFCFTGLMMFISTLGSTEEAVVGAGFGILMPMAMLGGGMIPLIAMPSWLLTASHISPFKWSILAVEGAIWRGFSLGDLLLPYAILLGVGGVCLYAGVRIMKWREG